MPRDPKKTPKQSSTICFCIELVIAVPDASPKYSESWIKHFATLEEGRKFIGPKLADYLKNESCELCEFVDSSDADKVYVESSMPIDPFSAVIYELEKSADGSISQKKSDFEEDLEGNLSSYGTRSSTSCQQSKGMVLNAKSIYPMIEVIRQKGAFT